MRKVYKEFECIAKTNPCLLKDEVQKIVEHYYNKGLEVDIKYSSAYFGIKGATSYSALILGYERRRGDD